MNLQFDCFNYLITISGAPISALHILMSIELISLPFLLSPHEILNSNDSPDKLLINFMLSSSGFASWMSFLGCKDSGLRFCWLKAADLSIISIFEAALQILFFILSIFDSLSRCRLYPFHFSHWQSHGILLFSNSFPKSVVRNVPNLKGGLLWISQLQGVFIIWEITLWLQFDAISSFIL